MLIPVRRGEFQNGVQDVAMKSIGWTTWDRKPGGYEGYLADSFRFLQAILLRQRAFRDKLYRPLCGEDFAAAALGQKNTTAFIHESLPGSK